MKSSRASRWSVLAVATLATGLHATGALAGNMSLTLDGIAQPLDVFAYSGNAASSTTLTTTGKVSYGNFVFNVPESAALPTEWLNLAQGRHLRSALLQVYSPATAKLTADWTFTDVVVTSITTSATPSAAAINTLSLAYGQIAYQVYAADGRVAARMCWSVTTNVKC